jgi:hypothetical protein
MRRGALTAACAALLAGPTVLAFFSGGYFDEPRAWAGVVAWMLAAVALIADPQGFPRGRAAWLALGALALFAAWTLLSITWAPLNGSAYHAGQLVVLYVGGLLAAAVLLRSRSALRVVEPGLAAGALIVVGYGISGRLLPGILHFARSTSAQGRLEQPLTYWNAMGELAALGAVLSVRIAGDATRRAAVRVAAAMASVPLALGLYLSFSRGALFACAAGLVTLVVVAPRREQLQSIVIALVAGVVISAASAPSRGVTALAGSIGTREREGAIALAALVIVMAAAGLVQWRLARRTRTDPLRLPRRAPWIALAVICVGLAIAIVAGAKEKSSLSLSAGTSRLVTLQSNRYAYWGVALRAFGDQPLRGVGAGGWAVYWLRYRTINEFAQDAHSLPLQTAAELGVVGLALLAAFLAGIGLAARDALRVAPVLAAGPIAGLVTYIAHAPLDWDWQMPAVTLVAIGLAGALLAIAERRARGEAIDLEGIPYARASPDGPHDDRVRIGNHQT